MSKALKTAMRQKAFLDLPEYEQLALILFTLYSRSYAFAKYVMDRCQRRGAVVSWQAIITGFWFATRGNERKSYLPQKVVVKARRGGQQSKVRKSGKRCKGKGATTLIRSNYDLHSLSLGGALAFLAQTCTDAVRESLVKTAFPPYWKVPVVVSELITWPTPCHRLMGPHVEDGLEALGLADRGEVGNIERKW